MIKVINDYEKIYTKFGYKVSDDSPFVNVVGYYIDDNIIGFLDYSLIYDKIEINYIFVDEKYRKNGIASKLFNYLFQKYSSIKNITLEVKKDNYIAINLYHKLGFIDVAIRKNYYNGIDGILMIKEV